MSSTLTPQDIRDEDFNDELKPGTELLHGQYVIEQFLNNGGFGITYLAKDSLLRMVVIKECFPEAICRRANSTVRVRSRDQADAFRAIVDLFIEEARGLARLSHPNIVGVHQVFEDNDTAYMAMDFVEGRDLLEIAEGAETIEPRIFEQITLKLLDAVEFIHSEGVLHRDISPDNVLLSKDNEPVLIDFGAARETVTRATSYLGSLRTVKDGYSPQEFYVKDSPQHPSSDLYALAASLYHVMCKELPVKAQTRMSAIAAGDPDPYVSIKHRVSGYSEPFLDAIDHALQVFPKNRIQSATEWRARIAGSTARQPSRGSVSRPMLAVDNGNVVQQYEEKESAPFASTRNDRPKQISVRSQRPASELEPGQRDTVSSQAQVARAMAPSSSGSSGKGLYIGVAAVALLAVGGGVVFMGGGSDTAPVPEQVATVEVVPESPAPEAVTPQAEEVAVVEPPVAERTPNRPEQVPFFLADSSSGDVEVSSAGGSRSTAADTGPLVTAQRPRTPQTQENATNSVTDVFRSEPSTALAGAGTSSALSTAQPEDTNAFLATLTQPTATETQELRSVVSGKALPFVATADPSDPTILSSIEGPAADILEPGWRIVSVNGFPMQAIADFQRVVGATSSFAVGDSVDVSFGVEDPATGDTFVRSVSLEAVQQTMLMNGVSFQTAKDGDTWSTTVIAAPPAQADSEFRQGDLVVALMPANELIDGQEVLPELIERELASGATSFNFAVKRDGAMWLVSMPYSGEAGN